jgi:hypothetical protein
LSQGIIDALDEIQVWHLLAQHVGTDLGANIVQPELEKQVGHLSRSSVCVATPEIVLSNVFIIYVSRRP